MTPATLKALKGSIAKWRKIVAGTGTDKGTHNCPLCKMFYDDGCDGCPVKIKTGWSECYDTPYWDWSSAADFYQPAQPRKLPLPGNPGRPAMLKAAKAELAFLESLLPEKKS